MQRYLNMLRNEDPSKSFSKPFYTDTELLNCEKPSIDRLWHYVGHECQLPEIGCYFEVSIGDESIIVSRGTDEIVFAFYNSCQHRGSRILDAEEKGAGVLKCPYHGYKYSCDGVLICDRHGNEPPNIKLSKLSLHSFHGLLFVTFDRASDFKCLSLEKTCAPLFKFHGVLDAKIVARKTYKFEANWKLVVENFYECDHCIGNHKELCSVESHILVSASEDVDDRILFFKKYTNWRNKLDELGHPFQPIGDIDVNDPMYSTCGRLVINDEHQTLSKDGAPLAPLMGDFHHYDHGETFGTIGPLFHYTLANDHIVLISISPVDCDRTSVTVTWLVDKQAKEGRDYNIDCIMWLWLNTVEQDKMLVERAFRGIQSRGYRPGNYSSLEKDSARFKKWYINTFSSAKTP